MALTDLNAPAGDRARHAGFAHHANHSEIGERTGVAGGPRGWSLDRARSLIALLALAGGGLLIAGEITDRLERVEGDAGLDAFNLIVASLLAMLIVCTGALIGDWVLARAEQRLGRRPGARLLAPLLTIAGSVSAGGIIIEHLRRAPALDAWIGITGSALLLLAAIAHHHLLNEAGPVRAPTTRTAEPASKRARVTLRASARIDAQRGPDRPGRSSP
jgi:hypothetical protein